MNCTSACTTIHNVSNTALFNGIKKKKKNIKPDKITSHLKNTFRPLL